jgi:hypothetical protein
MATSRQPKSSAKRTYNRNAKGQFSKYNRNSLGRFAKKAAPRKAPVKKAPAKKVVGTRAPVKKAPPNQVRGRLTASSVPRNKDFKFSTVTKEGDLAAHMEMMIVRAKYPKAFFQKIIAEFANMEAERFANFGPAPSYGIRGKWAPLSVNTYGATKTGTSSSKKLTRGPLVRFGHLQYAATHPVVIWGGNAGIEMEINPSQAKPSSTGSYGNDKNYGGYHQTGGGNLPRREIIPKITPNTIFGKYIGVIAKNYFLPSMKGETLPSEKGLNISHSPQVSSEVKHEVKRIQKRDNLRAERQIQNDARSKAYQQRKVRAKEREAERFHLSAQKKAEREAKRLETQQKRGAADITRQQHAEDSELKPMRSRPMRSQQRQTPHQVHEEHMNYADDRASFAKFMAKRYSTLSEQEHLARIKNIHSNSAAYRNASQEHRPGDFVPKGGKATMEEFKTYQISAPGWVRQQERGI